MSDFQRISDLVAWLNQRTIEYNNSQPTVTDKEWDDKYFELQELERQTGIIFPDSPTQSISPKTEKKLKNNSPYVVLDKLNKVEHNHAMLSLDKTKDLNEVKAFLGNQPWVAMLKLDGLTCSLTYENGKLVAAETRGNGEVGEDVLHNAQVIRSIPKRIPYLNKFVVLD